MSGGLSASYVTCRQIARRSASNFYYSFLLLPRAKRQAMCALYAFLRRTDDLGDCEEPVDVRREALARWRQSLVRALAGRYDDPLLPAVADTITRFGVPPEYLHAVIDGVEMDLDRFRYDTFGELEEYCYRVASVVGLSCIHIWGFRDRCALEPARQCGIAFQLTNILRDLKEDAQRGRVYLPQEDLKRFGYSVEDLQCGRHDDRFRALMAFQVARAEEFYRQGIELQRWLEPDGRRIFAAMVATYRGLLDEMKRLDGDVFTRRIRLSGWRKMQIAAKSLLLSRRLSSNPAWGALPR